jgi:hypothetical protein
MNITKILEDYKAALANKESERQKAIERQNMERIMNAEKAEHCIKTVIEPVFETVKKEIIANGFFCEVEFISQKDSSMSDKKLLNIGIKIVTGKESKTIPGSSCHMLYMGGFGAQEIAKEELIPGICVPPRKYPAIAISRIDVSMIENDLEQFLKKVFSI